MTVGISYHEKSGLWWPDYEQRRDKAFHFVMARIKDADMAIKRCPFPLVCVQAGGQLGMWPRRFATYFSRVLTFEPDPYLFECLKRNCEGFPAIQVYGKALGAGAGTVLMRPHHNAGGWRVSADGTIPVEQITIDSLQLDACSLIQLDVEGYEVEALKGAVKTIEKFKPILMVEQLPRAAEAIRRLILSMGYAHDAHCHGDYVYRPLQRKAHGPLPVRR